MSNIRNYSVGPHVSIEINWVIAKSGTCEISDPANAFFRDIYDDGINNLIWLDPAAIRSPADDKMIGAWSCEAWRFNWTNANQQPAEVITYVRYDANNNPIPVMTDLAYELQRFGRGAEAWYSTFSNEKITWETLNQWRGLNCQPGRFVNRGTNKLKNVIDLHQEQSLHFK